jgi:hypothetical protein
VPIPGEMFHYRNFDFQSLESGMAISCDFKVKFTAMRAIKKRVIRGKF